jgi:hypothetical protein
LLIGGNHGQRRQLGSYEQDGQKRLTHGALPFHARATRHIYRASCVQINFHRNPLRTRILRDRILKRSSVTRRARRRRRLVEQDRLTIHIVEVRMT